MRMMVNDAVRAMVPRFAPNVSENKTGRDCRIRSITVLFSNMEVISTVNRGSIVIIEYKDLPPRGFP